MSKFNLTIFTRYSIPVTVEANSKEEAEEKLWDLYNAGTIDPLDDVNADLETNIEYDGIA